MTATGFKAARRRKRTCKECLWNWPNLQTGKEETKAERVCYAEGGKKYHQEANGGCELYEKQLRYRMTLQEAARLKSRRKA